MATKKLTHNEIIEQLSKPLDIEDVEFRIQSISASGYATILPYKSARVDMNRLDKVCGGLWQDKYEIIDGQLFCSIGIKIEDEWIWRQDVGTESQTEKEKGRASDAFKRAGFRFGIGRGLYGYPRIFLQLKSADYVGNGKKGEFKTKVVGQKTIGTSDYGLRLDKWKWELETNSAGDVVRLKGTDETGLLRFDSNKEFNGLPNKSNQTPTQQPSKNETKSKPKLKDSTYKQALESTKVDVLTKALTKYDLTPDQLKGISARIAELNKKD